MKLHIFIESGIDPGKRGKGQFTNEHYFIEQYIQHLCKGYNPEDVDIVHVGGKDKLRMFDNQMKDYTRQGDTNIVIFDADYISTGGGLKKRIADFECLKQEMGVDFDYFLFPNNWDEGTFETLLLQIINKDHAGIIDCFSRYENCVEAQNKLKGGDCYEMPNTKAKIYSYITSFKMSNADKSSVKIGNWKFYSSVFWNLDDSYLEPLKNFLIKHLK